MASVVALTKKMELMEGGTDFGTPLAECRSFSLMYWNMPTAHVEVRAELQAIGCILLRDLSDDYPLGCSPSYPLDSGVAPPTP